MGRKWVKMKFEALNNVAAAWVEQTVKDFINNSPDNSLGDKKNEKVWMVKKAWKESLLGFSNGADPIYEDFKSHVGEFHWTPAEIFSEIYPTISFSSDELTVVSWILPQTETTKEGHRKASKIPNEDWIRARIFGEKVNEKLRLHVVDKLQEAGFEALAPIMTPNWEKMPSDRFIFSSKWSERHAAFASGLGTFGLCDGLITPHGKAIRAGSVIAKIQIPPSPRPYKDHRSYCLFYSKNDCGRCIQRCPAGALSKKGHDKRKCDLYIQNVVAEYVKNNYGFTGRGGCGLCQTGIPCESKIPSLDDLKK